MTCKKNEVYNACGSLSSELTCDAPLAPIVFPQAAEMAMVRPVCETGCYCKKDFYRNNKGNCVKKENCISKDL